MVVFFIFYASISTSIAVNAQSFSSHSMPICTTRNPETCITKQPQFASYFQQQYWWRSKSSGINTMPTDEPLPTVGGNCLLPSPVQFNKYFLTLDGGLSERIDMACYHRTLEFHHHRLENLKSRNIKCILQSKFSVVSLTLWSQCLVLFWLTFTNAAFTTHKSRSVLFQLQTQFQVV